MAAATTMQSRVYDSHKVQTLLRTGKNRGKDAVNTCIGLESWPSAYLPVYKLYYFIIYAQTKQKQ